MDSGQVTVENGAGKSVPELPESFPARGGMGFFGGDGELLGVVFLPATVRLVSAVAEAMPAGTRMAHVEVPCVRRLV